jgi:hypothetical protein
MAFLTEAQARSAVRIQNKQFVESELRKSASTDFSTLFDIFLSHSYLDAEVIEGIKELLEGSGLRVYVDWLEGRQLDRSQVTAATAELLRSRMRHSQSLIFATSSTSSNSKWMPWELGYLDGFRPGRVAILPLVRTSGDAFRGQEYLGLYSYMENVSFINQPQGLGIYTSSTTATSVKDFALSGV